jgi:Zn-dependent peptidase ImmA (M78 family)/transcriptional regulator with XRE-family HTH domain
MDVSGRLRSLRDRLGFATEQVAARAGITTDRLAAIEAGGGLSTWELAALADALAVDTGALYRGDVETDQARSVARFRQPAVQHEVHPEDARLLARAAEAGRTCHFLQENLGEPPSVLMKARHVRGLKKRPQPGRQGYELGGAARLALASDRRPLQHLQWFLEAHGVHVAYVRFVSTTIEAASLFERGAVPVILLNLQVSRIQKPLARRAIMAHELCHLLHDGGERELTMISREGDRTGVEARANGFAPNFLAPREWIGTPSGSPRDRVREIAATWGLSFEGAAWHAKNLALIEHDDADGHAAKLDLTFSRGSHTLPQRTTKGPRKQNIQSKSATSQSHKHL